VVAGDRLNKYGEFIIIDKIAKEYGYSHDDVFNLSWREVYTIVALSREQAYIEAKATRLKSDNDNIN